jgi:membrane associated rhomboid family serine protease
MIPLRNARRLEGSSIATRAIIAIDVMIFVGQFLLGSRGEALVYIFGFIPQRLFAPAVYDYSVLEVLVTLLSSIWLHGSVVHLLGNMIFLGAFGSDLERRIGTLRFLLLYVAGGVFGSLAHAFLYPASKVPSIGASGSIAAVLGAFLLLMPKARIVTLIPLIISWILVEVPAIVLLPLWFLIQFLNGFLALASASATQEVSSVAWWAHVGGFVLGCASALYLRKRLERTPATIAQEPGDS